MKLALFQSIQFVRIFGLVMFHLQFIQLQAATDIRGELLPNRQLVLRWNVAEGDWVLEQSDSVGRAAVWKQAVSSPVANGSLRSVTLDLGNATRFFRLRSAGAGSTSTSADLIDQAVESGVISLETGLVYKVFAGFKDVRLPAAYLGGDDPKSKSDPLEEAAGAWTTLSDAARQTLFPFFVPPAYRGSWLNPLSATNPGIRPQGTRPEFDPNWAAYPVAGGNVKVWYDSRDPNGRATAILCANALNNEIWPKITGLGILAPLSDKNVGDYDGGDDRLDVYLVDLSANSTIPNPDRGQTFSTSIARKQNPVFLLINKTLSGDELLGTLAHEFMHACEWAYPVKATFLDSYQWLKESTAQWAIDYVYPTNNLEQAFAPDYTSKPRMSLDVFKENKPHGYGSYLFFQFLTKSQRTALIANIWGATTNYSDQLEAVDKSIPGGFKEQFPKFARTLWNQDPVTNSPACFLKWDDMAEMPGSFKGSANLPAGTLEDTFTLGDYQPNLSSSYYHFTFSSAQTRSIMFHNTFYDNRKNNEDITVYAMWKTTAGTWTEEDWSKLEWIGFCRDQKNQRLSDLVIIVSSAKWRSPGDPIRAAKEQELLRNNIGCWGYEGSVSRVITYTGDRSGKTTMTANVRFGFQPSGQASDEASGRLRTFLIAPPFYDGGLTFDEKYTEGPCSYSASGSFPLSNFFTGGESSGLILINNFMEALPPTVRVDQEEILGPDSRSYTGSGESLLLIGGTVSGRDCLPTTYTAVAGGWWLTSTNTFSEGAPVRKANADGHLQGTFREKVGLFETSDYTWDLAPIQEP